jgi:hypothetical protein
MNGAAIIAAVRTATLVPVGQVSDADVLGWVNEGYGRIASLHPWPWLEGNGQFETVAEQQAYPLASAVVDDLEAVTPAVQAVRRIVAVYDDSKRVTLRQWSPSSAVTVYGDMWPPAAHATGFFLWANSLHLIPVPTGEVVYRVLFHKAVTPLAHGSSPEFDSMFHPALVHYGEYRAWQREEDLDKAAASYAHYSDIADRMGNWYMDRVDNSPWAIGVPGISGWLSNTPFLDGL